MKTLVQIIILCLALGSPLTQAAQTRDSYPLPWPFPWADKCSMDWEDLDGTYLLSNGKEADQLILRINILTKKGVRSVHVSRISSQGRMLYQGSTLVSEADRIIRLSLVSIYPEEPRIWATIKMHYQSEVSSCSASHLIPILTVQVPENSAPRAGVDYRMVKLDKK